jgi:hypothetical protein
MLLKASWSPPFNPGLCSVWLTSNTKTLELRLYLSSFLPLLTVDEVRHAVGVRI